MSGNLRLFYSLWISQFVSLLGTDISRFALRVWTYQLTGSVTQFAMITFFAEMPALLFSPLVGSIVDRYPRKLVMLAADTVSAASTLGIALLYYSAKLEVWHIYVGNITCSLMNAFQWPAFIATVSAIVPEEKRVKFAAINQIAPALSMLLAPSVAGALVATYGLSATFACEVATFLVGVIITSTLSINTDLAPSEARLTFRGILKDASEAISFILSQPALSALILMMIFGNITNGFVQILFVPMILNFADPTILGYVLTLSGFGALVGSGLLAVFSRFVSRRSHIVILVFGMQGFLLMCAGLRPSSLLLLFVAFCFMALIPVSRACREAIWQSKTPNNLQGRVFALQKGISQFAVPMAASLSGPLADLLVEPLLVDGGLLASSVGSMIGTGPGRGVAFLFILLGLTNMVFAASAFQFKPLRNVDDDIKAESAPASAASKKSE